MNIDYTVIIPIKDEEDNILKLFSELEDVMNPLTSSWELICINDGSVDKSLSILQTLAQRKKYVKILSFTKNFGQSSAIAAGFQQARGEILITLDGDGQNDPADIPQLLHALPQHDLVVGWRVNRKDSWEKRITSSFSNWIRRYVCQDGVHDSGCSLKILRKRCVEKIKMYRGMHRFLPALFCMEGFKVKEIPVNHRPRRKGKTKYHLGNRFLAPIIDLCVVYWMRKRRLQHKITPPPQK